MTMEDSSTLEDAIESVIQRVLYNEVSTFFPGKITAVHRSDENPNTVIVDVVSSFYMLNQETSLPYLRPIQSVPLLFANRTNTFIQRPPTDELSLIGASVGLIICNSYLANWKKAVEGIVTPSDARKFHYADAVAILGLYPDIQSWATPPKENTAQMKVSPGTFMEIGNSTIDLLRVIADMLFICAQPDSSGGSLSTVPGPIYNKTLAELLTAFTTLFNPDTTP